MLGPHRPRPAAASQGGLPPGKPVPQATAADERAAVRQFVSRVGGLDGARQALDLLAALTAPPQTGTERAA